MSEAMAKRWRVEKIGAMHPAFRNNPREYPVGHWYATDDHSGCECDWDEFSAPTHAEAISRIYARSDDER